MWNALLDGTFAIPKATCFLTIIWRQNFGYDYLISYSVLADVYEKVNQKNGIDKAVFLNYQMPFQMSTAHGESQEKRRNKCNRCIAKAKKLFVRIVPITEDSIKRLFTYGQRITFCLTFSDLRDENYFGVYHQKLLRMIFSHWVLQSNASAAQDKERQRKESIWTVCRKGREGKIQSPKTKVSQSIPIKLMNAVVVLLS